MDEIPRSTEVAISTSPEGDNPAACGEGGHTVEMLTESAMFRRF